MTTKNWIFNCYFFYKGVKGKAVAETRRHETLVCLRKMLEGKARFSVIAKDENKTNSCLLLRGYMNLNNTCNEGHAKKLLGKFSNCKPTVFGDVVMLMKLFHVDKQLTVTGRLPAQGNTVEELQGLMQLMRIGLSRLYRNRSTNKTLKVLRLNPNRKRWLPHNIKI